MRLHAVCGRAAHSCCDLSTCFVCWSDCWLAHVCQKTAEMSLCEQYSGAKSTVFVIEQVAAPSGCA